MKTVKNRIKIEGVKLLKDIYAIVNSKTCYVLGIKQKSPKEKPRGIFAKTSI